MNTKIILALLLVTAAFPSAAYGKGLFDHPETLFSEAFLPVLSHFERGRIQNTWRGFYLRGDTQAGFRNEYDPSEAGLYLDVGVRDPAEISKFEDSRKSSGKLTERTIEFPATKRSGDALRIIFIYGAKADAGAMASINKDIGDMIKAYKAAAPSP
jgi:hypothetical protein